MSKNCEIRKEDSNETVRSRADLRNNLVQPREGNDWPIVAQQGLECEPMDSVSGALSTFPLLLLGLGLKDRECDWPNTQGRQTRRAT